MKFTLTALLLLVIALIALGLLYGYPDMLQLLPQGSHLWRQADSYAMTQNYHQYGLPFLQPETYNLQSAQGKVAGEFPLFYFIAAQFKNTTLALRLLHTGTFFSGIIAIYFISFYFLQRRFLSVLCTLFMCTSPLLIFYGNNFLSDVPALSMAFMGWAFFLYAYQKEQFGWLSIGFCCFTLAGLLKASEVINLAMLTLFLYQQRNKKSIFKWSQIWMVISGLFIFIWYAYAKQYNREHHDTYYFLSVSPIWKLTAYEIGLGLWRMIVSLSRNYFWHPASVVLLMAAFYMLRHRKKLDAELRVLIASGMLLTILYILLFYQKMIGHEYYYVPFFIFILFALIGILKTYNFFHAENVFTHTALFLFLLLNIYFCKSFVSQKLTDNLYNGNMASVEMQQFLTQHGVTEKSILLSLPDDSPNKTLSLLKRKGYTEFNDYPKVLRQQQADFLIVGNDKWKQRILLQPYLKDSIGNFHGITLYKLK